jgi:endogenous inhibitor of DNA gyrase (YacG/DUF329 family)
MHCPTCEKEFSPATSPALPFCSERCRLIDLGRWLDEKQRVPFEPAEDEESEPPQEDEGD